MSIASKNLNVFENTVQQLQGKVKQQQQHGNSKLKMVIKPK